ncbi:MAG: iron complex outerrane recepter protein, partial [Caballeronia sp.]|nr:iron complex outerrane recepter protein [Caballeronia sp.]
MARQQSERRGADSIGARGRARNPWRLAPIAAAVFLATSAFAQSDAVVPADATGQPAASAPGQQLPAVVVKGQRDAETGTGPVKGYVAKQSTAGSKTDTPIIKTPQAISVVTRDQMDIQDAQSVAQA